MKLSFLIMISFAMSMELVQAQFGMKKKIQPQENEASQAEKSKEVLVDLNDPELQDAIKMFQDMSPQEMIETIQQLKEDPIYKDDPSLVSELDAILEELSQLNTDENEQSLGSILDEELAAQSILDTMEMLKNADANDWQKIIDNKDLILDSVIASGIMTKEETDLFKNDDKAWEEELRGIWKELKAQADTVLANDEL